MQRPVAVEHVEAAVRERSPDVVVDISNVCRDGGLSKGASGELDRYLAVVAAWRAQVNPYSRFLAIADNSLSRDYLSEAALAEYARLQAAREVVSVPYADPVILDVALRTGASVLSKDGYVGLRREHAWLQGDDEHFWQWRPSDGRVAIEHRPMGVRADYSITRAAERDLWKALRQNGPDSREVLALLYRCLTAGCQAGNGAMADPPARRDGKLKCPACLRPVEPIGPRPDAREFKLVDSDVTVRRFRLASDQTVVVGSSRKPGVESVAEAATLGPVPARWMRLSVLGTQVTVEAVVPEPAVWVERWDPASRGWKDDGALLAEPVVLRARDRVRLSAQVFLEQSARAYVVPDYY